MKNRMRKIIQLPIEPLDMRYSSQWANWFTDYFCKDINIDLYNIKPHPLTQEIVNGAFLDVCGTNYFKAKQLARVCEMAHSGCIDENTVIFLHDGWFPGIEMLAYIRDGLGIPFKIAGCFHAGTYDPTDFISKKGMGEWGESLENSWFKIFDAVFVATCYHKELITKNRKINADKIHVTGFPLYPPVAPGVAKENIIVFPHRLTDDKHPYLFYQLAEVIKQHHPDWQCIATQEIKRTKKEYYGLLQKSKIAISFALHENWGIAMQEAVMLNNIPIVPDRLSYKEMYPSVFRYKTYDDAVAKTLMYIQNIIDNNNFIWLGEFYKAKSAIELNGRMAIPKIVEILHAL